MSAPTTRAPAPNPDLPAADLAVPATPNRIAPQQLTGAQSVVRSLEELGVEVIFRIPGGAVLPVYDPLYDSQKLRRPGPSRAGRWARRQRLRARDRQGRRVHGHFRSRRDQPRDTAGRCPDGFGSRGCDHRPGRSQPHRHRRVPGSRHLGHHDAHHQAQLPGAQWRRDPASDRRGVPHRRQRASRVRCWSTFPRTSCRASASSPGRRSWTCPVISPTRSRTAVRSRKPPS